MQQVQITVYTGTFVVFEGFEKPTEDTSGRWVSWATEVPNRDVAHAVSIMPPGTVRLSFFDLQLLPDDMEKNFKDGELQRFLGKDERKNRSCFFYVNCIRISADQAFKLPYIHSASKVGREILVPRINATRILHSLSVAYEPNRRIVIGSDRCPYLLEPRDKIISTREPYEGEFRTLYV